MTYWDNNDEVVFGKPDPNQPKREQQEMRFWWVIIAILIVGFIFICAKL